MRVLTNDASAALALTELFIKQTRSRASVLASRQPVGDKDEPPPCVLGGRKKIMLQPIDVITGDFQEIELIM